MTLTLAIDGADRLANGAPAELVLHRRGAVIGRAGTCDWPLPDPSRHLSSRHCEIRFDGVGYTLTDCSTNGTVFLATGQRLAAAHQIADGDRFQIGPYVIAARLSGDARGAAAAANPAPAPTSAWSGWDAGTEPSSNEAGTSDWSAMPGGATAAGVADWRAPGTATGWEAPAPQPDSGGRWQPRLGPTLAREDAHRAAGYSHASASSPAAPSAASGWVPSAAMVPPPTPSTWEPAAPPHDPASSWSSAAPDRPAAASPDDLWGRIAEGNVVDWARGGFGQSVEPVRDPLGIAPAPSALPTERPTPPVAPSIAVAPPPATPPTTSAATEAPSAPINQSDAFAASIGLSATELGEPTATLAIAGALLRRLVAGLVVMMEARARAKTQLGAEATAYSPEGHNPLKLARTPDEALALLLGAPRPGFMSSERAVEDAFVELQSHQVATLRAMQGALRATLERFSPAAIRARADAGGMIERIVPTARDAALWQAYSREFGGVVEGSDEAFLDIFAKEFREAYNDQVRRTR